MNDLTKFTMDFFSTLQANQRKIAGMDKDIDEKSGRLTQEHLDNCNGCPKCEN